MRKSICFICTSIVLIILSSCGQSKSTHMVQVDDHKIVIVDTSGRGGTSRHDKSNGAEVFTHDSGNCKIKLEENILTVNGKTYIVSNKTDSITINDGRVQINGTTVKAEKE